MTRPPPATPSRRLVIAGIAGGLATGRTMAGHRLPRPFPPRFLWGAATSGHQTEGNNVGSDMWLLEHLRPTIFDDPSNDACNSFELWPADLALVRDLGLSAYRFSLEWARIEPERGQVSVAMLDHYRRIIAACHGHGLVPIVTFNHFTTPRWFAAAGGWTNRDAPELFGRFCDRAARALADGIGYATTLNEPDLLPLLNWRLKPQAHSTLRAMLAAAAKACDTPKFCAANMANDEDIAVMTPLLIAGHKAGRAAIKAARGTLPVGVSLAVQDDVAVGAESIRDLKRAEVYAPWFAAARDDDFVGVQNYERMYIGAHGTTAAPAGVRLGHSGQDNDPTALDAVVRYVHAQVQRPILVTENGLNTPNDADRVAYIPAALAGLHAAIADGVPVLGYVHWSLLDNFEWSAGYGPKFGLVAVDRTSFRRTPKPSAALLGRIAQANALQ
jgi:beta-glucosidase